MDATARQARFEAAQMEEQRSAEALAVIEAEDATAVARIAAIDEAATVTRDRLVDLENLRRRRRQLAPEREAAARAVESARSALMAAERLRGGVVSIKGLAGVGIGPTQAQYLRADGAAGAAMFLERQGVRVVARGEEMLVPFASLSEVVTEDARHDVAWIEAQAKAPIADVPPASVRDALLVESFRFGFERPEDRLSRLRGATIALGAEGLDVVFRGKGYVVPYGQVLVAELEPAAPPAGVRPVSVAWFKSPIRKATPPAALRLAPRREPEPQTAPAFAGVPLGASGVHAWLSTTRRPSPAMWLGPTGVHVHLDGRHWLVPFPAVRFAKLEAGARGH